MKAREGPGPSPELQQVWDDMRQQLAPNDVPCSVCFTSQASADKDNEFAEQLFALMVRYKIVECVGVVTLESLRDKQEGRRADN